MSEKNISIVQSKNNAYTNAAAKLFARVGAVLSCMAFILLIGEGFASVKNYIIIAIGSTVVCACSLFLGKNKIPVSLVKCGFTEIGKKENLFLGTFLGDIYFQKVGNRRFK